MTSPVRNVCTRIGALGEKLFVEIRLTPMLKKLESLGRGPDSFSPPATEIFPA
jgi:hypothetical protein